MYTKFVFILEVVSCLSAGAMQIEQSSADVEKTLSSFEAQYMNIQNMRKLYYKKQANEVDLRDCLKETIELAEGILMRSKKWDRGIFKRRQLIPLQSAYLLLLEDLDKMPSNVIGKMGDVISGEKLSSGLEGKSDKNLGYPKEEDARFLSSQDLETDQKIV